MSELSTDASELVLHGDNTEHVHRQSFIPVVKNLARKMKAGKYDHEKAKKLWGYHANKVAQSYTKEHGTPGDKWHHMFSPSVRREAASHWADRERDNIKSGEYAHLMGEAWGNDYETPKSKRGMFKGRSLSSLESQDKHVSGTKKKQVDFAIRAKTGWGKVAEDEEPLDELTGAHNPKALKAYLKRAGSRIGGDLEITRQISKKSLSKDFNLRKGISQAADRIAEETMLNEDKTLKCKEVSDDDDKDDKKDDKGKPDFFKKKDKGDKDDDDKDDKDDKKDFFKKKFHKEDADGTSTDNTEVFSFSDYAKAIAMAAVQDKPADVSQVFGDAIRSRVADLVADYQQDIEATGFDTQEEPDAEETESPKEAEAAKETEVKADE